MGRCKALLVRPDTGRAFVRSIVDAYLGAGVDDIVVTVPDGDDGALVEAAVGDAAATTKNPWPSLGISGSIRACLASLTHAPDILVLCPVDAPFATSGDVRALVDAISAGAPAAVVTGSGRRGHPVAFSRSTFQALSDAAEHGGPRAVLDALGAGVAEIEAGDERVAVELNTPDELAALSSRGRP